jgi:SAM-dependent methyltransferase
VSEYYCNACNGKNFDEVLNLGETPIAHRFLPDPFQGNEYTHSLVISLCRNCGLIQILNPIPPEELYRDYNFCFSDWKPQPHVIEEINLIDERIQRANLVLEVGCNDGMFLGEMNKMGFSHLIGVEPNKVCFERASEKGVLVYNDFFDTALADRILADHGKAHFIVIRQVMEHIANLQELMGNFRRLVHPKCWILIEVPDFESALKYGDCSALWEEHVNYFTESTLIDLIEKNGFSVKHVGRFSFSGGALMVLAQHQKEGKRDVEQEIDEIKDLAMGFSEKVAKFKERLVCKLESNRNNNLQNILYGSGCRANTVINGLQLGGYFNFIVDDQAEKQSLLMPGCRLKISSSDALNNLAGSCFLSVNHENEVKVIEKHKKYIENGGGFFSLNAPSPLFV